MKKQLILVGIIVLLICVGLSGCSNLTLTNIGDISANPEKFLNKEVTVEGGCASTIEGGFGVITDQGSHSIMYHYNNSLFGMYRLSGIIKKSNEYIVQVGYSIYLEVSTATGIS